MKIKVYFHHKSICFSGIANTIANILNKNNISSEVVNKIMPNDDNSFYIIMWPNLDQPLPKKCAIYNFDPMVPHVIKELFGIIGDRKDIIIWDYCYSQQNYMTLKHLNYQILPYGISDFNIYDKENIEKDIDVLFFGGMNKRRKKIIDKLTTKNPDLNIVLRLNDLYE